MKLNADNERIKHRYFTFLEEAKQLDASTVDGVAQALDRFETYTERRDFKRFHREQAIGFKKSMAKQLNSQTGDRLSKATIYTTLNALKGFFFWLASQPGYKSRFEHADSEFFNMSLKDTAVAKATRTSKVPSPEEIRQVLAAMPSESDIEKRDRALVAFTFLTGVRVDALASLRLKHVSIDERMVYQDARNMRTKFSKSFPTYFFEVGDDIRFMIEEWVGYLVNEKAFDPNDPLFPKTQTGLSESGVLGAVGLSRDCWRSTESIRNIFRKAFERAGLPYYHPHSFRKTLIRLGMEWCDSIVAFKAWSQNIGHDDVMTSLRSYGDVPEHRQRELIRATVERSADDRMALELGRKMMAAGRG